MSTQDVPHSDPFVGLTLALALAAPATVREWVFVELSQAIPRV